ncbi:hypothetical protein MRX96_002866 [Rhipicephalus microplus]
MNNNNRPSRTCLFLTPALSTASAASDSVRRPHVAIAHFIPAFIHSVYRYRPHVRSSSRLDQQGEDRECSENETTKSALWVIRGFMCYGSGRAALVVDGQLTKL